LLGLKSSLTATSGLNSPRVNTTSGTSLLGIRLTDAKRNLTIATAFLNQGYQGYQENSPSQQLFKAFIVFYTSAANVSAFTGHHQAEHISECFYYYYKPITCFGPYGPSSSGIYILLNS
jgi:hypothetical protein